MNETQIKQSMENLIELLNFRADIREAIGDTDGKLTMDELVTRCQHMGKVLVGVMNVAETLRQIQELRSIHPKERSMADEARKMIIGVFDDCQEAWNAIDGIKEQIAKK